MKDILPGAQLIEVRVGLNRGDTPLASSKYFCTLVFQQTNGDQVEIIHDTYSISDEQMLQKFLPLTSVGKHIKQCTKSVLGKAFVVRYDFEDGSYLNTWS